MSATAVLRRVSMLRTKKRTAIDGDYVITLENVASNTGKLTGYTPAANVSGELIEFHIGDVLFNKLRPYLAKVYSAKSDGLCTGEMLVLMPDRTKLDQDYLLYFLLSRETIETVNVATYGVKMPRANWDFIGSLEIRLPTFEDQQKIAKYLHNKISVVDKMIGAKNHTHTQLAELRTAIIAELIYGKNGGVVSGSDQLYRHLLSQETGTWGEDPNGDNEVKCLRVADFDYLHLSHKKPGTVRTISTAHLRTKLLKRGDILIEKSGGGEKTPVGRAIIVSDLSEETTYANFIDRLRFRQTVLPDYALYLLYSLYAAGVNTKYIKQNTGIQNLDIKHYLMEQVPIPSIKEQQRVVAAAKNKLAKLDAANDILETTIAQLEEYRTSLISNVITGKVEV